MLAKDFVQKFKYRKNFVNLEHPLNETQFTLDKTSKVRIYCAGPLGKPFYYEKNCFQKSHNPRKLFQKGTI